MNLLSIEEFRTLFYLYKAGDRSALAKIVAHNQGLVGSIADRYATYIHNGAYGNGIHSVIEWDDLKQAGNVGMLRAIERFDIGRGTQFSTYATAWIRKEILLFINSCLFIKQAKGNFRFVIPLEDYREYKEVVDHGFELQVQQKVNAEADKKLVDELLGALSERDRRIISLRFGLTDGQERTHAEISQVVGLSTRQRVQQIVNATLLRLQRAYNLYLECGKVISPAVYEQNLKPNESPD